MNSMPLSGPWSGKTARPVSIALSSRLRFLALALAATAFEVEGGVPTTIFVTTVLCREGSGSGPTPFYLNPDTFAWKCADRGCAWTPTHIPDVSP